ncbi:MAG: 4-(cytidine 5'-diphospho)-2-C-methyl-D-erythritol kinase [Ignavibacteriales bacterium]|nr:4-(cytidine 5'-diphospho)-2-C-methyl-D-erythritol kinase [Ignavibacteriales bacterium]
MTTRAYAKINLGLRILRKRPDGYHDIETVYHQVNLFDELEFRLHERDVLLTSDYPAMPADHSNLCIKAASLLRDLTGMTDGVEIRLVKNIPLGSGLGGGSADAAATLISLIKLWNLDITANELHTLALTLGSDVPFFLNGGSAYATSRGEILEPFSLSFPYWIILVTPPVHVSTAWAYKNLKRDEPAELLGFKSALVGHLHDPTVLSKTLVNDFEPVVFKAHPEIKKIRDLFHEGGAELSMMSGSGASIYALTRSETVAKNLSQAAEGLGRVSVTRPFFSPSKQKDPEHS